jgi:predicted acetyltransferase
MAESVLTDGVIELRLLGRSAPPDLTVPLGYEFAIVLAGTEIGRLLLFVDDTPGRTEYAGHIAYEIAPEHRGRRYAARACLLVRSVAREHLEVAWIMCSPDNCASARTAELVGAVYVDTREVPERSDIRALGVHWVRRYRWEL